jgi:catechol 2,3-dioxygenase-like lactoylglutathione lyase family enzyme
MTDTATKASSPVGFEGMTPILRVRDLAASLRHYVDVLGFHVDWSGSAGRFASVSRGRCNLFLAQGDQGHAGGWVWIGVEDVEALHEEYRVAGARIRHPPTNYPWACEMQVEDLDGNVLRLGSEPKAGEPYGEWLDMQGRRWPLREAT